jgi:hypothetical protein
VCCLQIAQNSAGAEVSYRYAEPVGADEEVDRGMLRRQLREKDDATLAEVIYGHLPRYKYTSVSVSDLYLYHVRIVAEPRYVRCGGRRLAVSAVCVACCNSYSPAIATFQISARCLLTWCAAAGGAHGVRGGHR